ncbi:MAG: aminoacyl-tRNA hydrolase [Clostridiales bacterium]|nr:aminoacyl-tRNA hydrolase [Clostridiales bacterium]
MLFFQNAGSIRWLIVFLGNPGPKYAGTRHNAGFLTADAMERAKNISINRVRFQALTAQCQLGGERVLLMKPQTFMNLSGRAVAEAVRFYKLTPQQVLVVYDDVSLPPGKLRFRLKGSAGGHNGIKSIIAELGSDAFPRLKIGVGAPPHPDYDMADWVLSVFHGQDAEIMAEAAGRAVDALELFIEKGPEKAMNLYN